MSIREVILNFVFLGLLAAFTYWCGPRIYRLAENKIAEWRVPARPLKGLYDQTVHVHTRPNDPMVLAHHKKVQDILGVSFALIALIWFYYRARKHARQQRAAEQFARADKSSAPR